MKRSIDCAGLGVHPLETNFEWVGELFTALVSFAVAAVASAAAYLGV